LTLRNRQFTEHVAGGTPTRRSLTTAAEIRNVLQSEFLIRWPQNPKLDERLARLPE